MTSPPTTSPILRRLGAAVAVVTSLLLILVVLTPVDRMQSAAAAPPSGSIGDLDAVDGTFSANAAALVDGAEGADPTLAWANSGNPWSADSYPMSAVIDLGQLHDITALHYHGGQIPYPATAALEFESSADGTTFSPLATATNPGYDVWSDAIPVAVEARYVRLSFGAVNARFNVSEVAVVGTPVGPDDPDDPDDPGNPGAGTSQILSNVAAQDGDNSSNAHRLVDTTVGPNNPEAWTNPNPWDPTNFPMTATLTFDDTYDLTKLRYFVGNIQSTTDNEVTWQYSPDAAGNTFQTLYVGTGHAWNDWHETDLAGQTARRLRVRFDSVYEMFNLAEVEVHGVVDGPDDPDDPDDPDGPDDPDDPDDPDVAHLPDPVADGALQAAPPATGERATAYGHSTTDAHLSPACRTLHDRYWTYGPDNKAYRTWHPAITYVPETATDPDPEICDFGHEHGYMPTKAAPGLFELSGGWPAFGYAAEQAGMVHNHESHVGHKVTVAEFRAAVGNAANKGSTLYDAGFDCAWLSKIHQGSFGVDALANSTHEYFLTLRCLDGPGGSVGTEFSVKFLYTFGERNLYNAVGCLTHTVASGDTSSSIAAHYGITVEELAVANPNHANSNFTDLTLPRPGSTLSIPAKADYTLGFDGNPIPLADRPSPGPNSTPNGREFVCASGVVWNLLDNLQDVTLWTQPNWIEREGDGVLMIQPYYSVIDMPWMLTGTQPDPSGQAPYLMTVARTLDLCYPNGTRLYPDDNEERFCDFGPYQKPTNDWEDAASPFNGTRRAVNFKTAWLNNGGGVDRWCTDAFGRSADGDDVSAGGGCGAGSVEQYATTFDNHWNDGSICVAGVCNITGSIRSTDPWGRQFAAEPNGSGGYIAPGPAKEFIIDNSQPDDNFDGQPDGANIRGRN